MRNLTPAQTLAEKDVKNKKKSKSDFLRAYFALVFLQHTSFSFQGRMATRSKGEELGVEL